MKYFDPESFVTVILIGGARRVTLAEQLIEKITALNLGVRIVSIEKDNNFYPISVLAKTIVGPNFSSVEFDYFISDLIEGAVNPLIVPCMDGAISAISKYHSSVGSTKRLIAHSVRGAQIALDKNLTNEFCVENNIKHPEKINIKSVNHSKTEVICKPAHGFGGRGIQRFSDASLVPENLLSTHIIQEYIEGVETTHDIYFCADGTYHVSSRDRLSVIDGEVDHCIVRLASHEEHVLFGSIAQTKLFFGPTTIQTIQRQNQVYLIEINARFGGGVTASIAAGYPGVEFLIEETFGIKVNKPTVRKLEMKRARRDFYRFID